MKPLKMRRDKVISMTNKGDRVGLYVLLDKNEVLLAEVSPEKADKIIEVYNKLTK